MPHHGIPYLMSFHRHSLQGRKAPWIHTAEGDDDMPGASDDCIVNMCDKDGCADSRVNLQERQVRPIIKQSVLWAGGLNHEIIACK